MNKISLAALLLLSSQIAFASPITVDVISAPQGLTIQNQNATLTLPTNKVTEAILTQTNAVAISNKTFSASSQVAKQAVGTWDFSVQGATSVGTPVFPLLSPTLPKNAIIRNVLVDILTQPTASTVGACTVVLSANASGDIYQTACSGMGPGWQVGKPLLGTTSTYLKLAGATGIGLTQVGSTFTGGKFALIVDYVLDQ